MAPKGEILSDDSIQQRLALLQAKLQQASAARTTESFEDPEDLVRDGRLTRLNEALGSISMHYETVEQLSEGEYEAGPERPLLAIERMHKAYGNHPYVISRRPYYQPKDSPSQSSVELLIDSVGWWPLLTREEEVALKKTIDKGLTCFAQLEARDWDSEEEQESLTQAVLEGTDAYLRFFEANMRLPLTVVNRYIRNKNVTDERVDFDSLYFVGLEILSRAIQKFNPDKGFKFSTYAIFWIRQAISREIRSTRRLSNISEDMESLYRHFMADNKEFKQARNRNPTQTELEKMGYSLDEQILAHRLSQATSLDEPLSEESSVTRGDLIADTRVDVESDAHIQIQSEMIQQQILNAGLEQNELLVLAIKYGIVFDGQPQVNQRAAEFFEFVFHKGFVNFDPTDPSNELIAEFLNVSRQTIANMKTRAFTKIADLAADSEVLKDLI